MFLVHPTRLSKIFAESRTHPRGNARHRQASKLIGHTHAKSRTRSPKLKSFEKNLPGRPYSAPAVARPEFCYHSLQEDRNLYTIPPTRTQIHTSNAARPSKSATPSEYQNRYKRASPFCNYFCIRQHKIVGQGRDAFNISTLQASEGRWLEEKSTRRRGDSIGWPQALGRHGLGCLGAPQ
jgi:hypothetical protein